MSLFRSILFWLVLVVLGALLAQVLLQDPGYVLVRYRGTDYTTTVAAGIAILLAAVFALFLLWALLRLPVQAWHQRRARQARAKLTDGLAAYDRGDYVRAEQLLKQAADAGDVEAVSRTLAARAALARGDAAGAAAHVDAFADREPAARALLRAEQALALGRPEQALEALDAPAAQPLPPRGLLLRAEALEASGRSFDAYGLVGALRQHKIVPDTRLDALQQRWARQALEQADDDNALADRWDALPAALRSDPAVVRVYATRAAALHWDEAATRSVEHALEAGWNEELADLYGRLPVGRLEHRRAQVARWLSQHPTSPGLLLASARLEQAQGHWAQSEAALQRAIALGAGAPAWEALGECATRMGDEQRARLAYANALRSQRGEAPLDVPVSDAAAAVAGAPAIEVRDEHGIPRRPE